MLSNQPVRKCAVFLLALCLLYNSQTSVADFKFSLSSMEYSVARFYANRLSDTHKSQSGTISFRLPDPSMELSIPFLWLGEGTEPVYDDDPHCCKHNFVSMDLQFRKYLSDKRNGWFAGLVVRGVTGNGYVNDQFIRQTKLEMGATLGYRKVIGSALYWSTGVSWASLASAFREYDTSVISTADPFRQRHSLTVDFLKIGILLP